MKSIKYFILLFTLLWTVRSGYTQAVLEGTLFLSDTQSPAMGAYVQIAELERATVADAEGRFRLENLPPGVFTLEVSYIGYQTLLESVTIREEQDQLRLELRLEPREYELEGVVITGGYITTQDDNAIKIEKMEPGALRRATNYLEALSRMPGVDNISRGPGIGKPVIRGLSNNQVLVLNNGVRNQNFQYASNHPIGLDEWGVERIEIIKGPASLLYGSGAIGGVVNLLKDRPAAPGELSGDVLTQYHSNTQGFSGTAGLRAGGEHFFGGARIGGKTHADYLDGNGDFAPNTRFNTLALRSHAGYRSDQFVSKLYYDYDGQNLGMYSGFTKQNITERGRDLEVWYQNLDNHLLNWQNTLILKGFQIKADLAWQSNHRRLQNPKTSPEQPDLGAPINMRMNTLTYNARAVFRPSDALRFIGGLQGLASSNRNDDQAKNIILPDGQMNDYGIYGLAQYRINPVVNTQLGLRYDFRTIHTELTNAGQPSEKPAINEQFSNLSASLGATYDIADNWLLRINIASGFRAPNFIELSANGLHGNRWERGDPNLSPERSFEADLSGHYHGKNLTFEVAGFYNRITNYIFLQPTDEEAPVGGGVIFEYTQGNSRLYGFEGGFHLHPAGAEWLHLASSYNIVRGEQDNGDHLPLIPAQQWKNEVGVHGDIADWLRDGFFQFTIDHTSQQDRPAPFEQATGGYTLLGLQLGAEFLWAGQRLEWQIAVNNLLNKDYLNHLSTLRPLEVLEPGRNVVVSLLAPFGNR